MKYRYNIQSGVTKIKTNTKKYVIGTISGLALVVGFAAPVLAAQPITPGCVGAAVSGQAHAWDGRGDVVSGIAKTGVYGDGVKAYLASDPCNQ